MSYQREYERRLRVGFVGVGSHAYRNLLPTLTFLPVELCAVCDLDLERARVTAVQYGAPGVYTSTAEMYAREELDAVFLAVSPRLHPQLTCEAFDAGLHVWLEKPPAIRAAQVAEMISHQGDRVCVVGFKKAFTPAADKVAEILAEPAYGPLRSLLAVYPLSLPREGARLLAEGNHTNNLCHPMALMMRIGGNISAVTTYRARAGGGCVVCEFTSGAIGTLHMADGSAAGVPHEHYMFYGNGVHVEVDNFQRVGLYKGIPFKYERTTHYAPAGFDHGVLVWEPQNNLATLENKALFTQGIYGEMRYFCDCVLEQRPAELCGLPFALELMQVHEAALLSEGDRTAVAG